MDVYQEVQEHALQALDVHRNHIDQLSDAQIRNHIADRIYLAMEDRQQDMQLITQVTQQVLDDLLGLGPLEKLLADEQVSEIMVNRHDQIFIEEAGVLKLSSVRFQDESSVRRAIERIVTPLGRRIDESSPMVDARLACGSRVNAIIPPLAIDGSSITIRKFSKTRLLLPDLVRLGSLNQPMADFLCHAVQQQKNIIVSGGTGSGKTTLLNIMADAIPDQERIVTIEDAAELSILKPNLVRLESRPANQEGEGQVHIGQLLVNALRMRPDRIVIGECRSGESLDMLQAMNTGHDGSMTTLHANTPRDAIRRLETMVLMAGVDLPLMAIRQQIASAVHLIVQITRQRNGQRKITSITEIQGLEGEVVCLAELYRWDACVEQHRATGDIPLYFEQLNDAEKIEYLPWFQE